MKLELTRDDLIELIQADGRFQIDEEFSYPLAQYSERIYKNNKTTYKRQYLEVDDCFSILFDLKAK